MNDITAVVLTIGEDTTFQALASLRLQSHQPAEIILVDSVTPFHMALNWGASRVKTEFFIQVDADMILDRYCVEDLRNFMTQGVGIVQGPLADPLLGVVLGVRVFRTICFQEVALRDTIAPDTDFYKDMAAHGWEYKLVLSPRINKRPPGLWRTFGRHCPSYTPLYTYWKFFLLGRRCRYRRDLLGVQWRFRQLDRGRLPVALIAQIALSHGIFLDVNHDLLVPYKPNVDFRRLEHFLTCDGRARMRDDDMLSLLNQSAEDQFYGFCQLGSRLGRAGDAGGLRHCLELLRSVPVEQAWLARVGLGHGIFLDRTRRDRLRKEYTMVQELWGDGRSESSFCRRPTCGGGS